MIKNFEIEGKDSNQDHPDFFIQISCLNTIDEYISEWKDIRLFSYGWQNMVLEFIVPFEYLKIDFYKHLITINGINYDRKQSTNSVRIFLYLRSKLDCPPISDDWPDVHDMYSSWTSFRQFEIRALTKKDLRKESIEKILES